jgi:hypothetical protein
MWPISGVLSSFYGMFLPKTSIKHAIFLIDAGCFAPDSAKVTTEVDGLFVQLFP